MEGAAILSSLAATQSPPRAVGEVVGIAASVPPDLPPTDPSSQVREREGGRKRERGEGVRGTEKERERERGGGGGVRGTEKEREGEKGCVCDVNNKQGCTCANEANISLIW